MVRTKASSKKTRSVKKTAKKIVTLPTQPLPAGGAIGDFSFLFYGAKKIGKTTLWNQEEGKTLYLQFDPPQRALERYEVHCPDWATFEGALQQVLAQDDSGDFEFETLVVDGVDLMYSECLKAVCKTVGCNHPSDKNDFGKTWGQVKEAFGNAIRALLALRTASSRFIAHDTTKEVEDRRGRDIERVGPAISGQADEVIMGVVDAAFYYGFDGTERVIRIVGAEDLVAGHRIDHAFRVKGSERQVYEIPAGKTPAAAYAALERAFDNKQPFATLAERDQAAKISKKVGKKAAKKKVVK